MANISPDKIKAIKDRNWDLLRWLMSGEQEPWFERSYKEMLRAFEAEPAKLIRRYLNKESLK